VIWNDFLVNRSLINSKNDNIYNELFNTYEKIIDSCNAAIMLDNNIEAYKGINHEDLINFKQKYYLKIFKKIMDFERRVYLRYPEQRLADLFGVSYEEHIKLLEEVSNFNYQVLNDSCMILKKLMDKTNKIKITQGLTDVTFTKKDISSSICLGKINLPD
jgi:aminopeptidase